MIAVCGALGNAIEEAVGADLTHMPIRQEDVWRAMQKKIAKTPAPRKIRAKKAKAATTGKSRRKK
jgi:hypothetical protein